MNISSVVVQSSPENVAALIKVFKNCDFCEYHLHDEKGRIIVTIEGKNVEEEITKMQSIENIEEVLSAQMVFSYAEDELDQERNKLEAKEELPDWLNDPKAKLRDIKYGGDLKGRF